MGKQSYTIITIIYTASMSTPKLVLKWQSARDVDSDESAAVTYVCTFKDITKRDDDGKWPDCSTHWWY